MYTIIQFTICLQFVYNLFTFCSHGVHIYMLYCIMEGGSTSTVQWNQFHSSEKINRVAKPTPENHHATEYLWKDGQL